VGRSLKDKEVFYPVRNGDFRGWRKIKNRGGNFLIFSDLEIVKLSTPIVIDLGERYQDYAR